MRRCRVGCCCRALVMRSTFKETIHHAVTVVVTSTIALCISAGCCSRHRNTSAAATYSHHSITLSSRSRPYKFITHNHLFTIKLALHCMVFTRSIALLPIKVGLPEHDGGIYWHRVLNSSSMFVSGVKSRVTPPATCKQGAVIISAELIPWSQCHDWDGIDPRLSLISTAIHLALNLSFHISLTLAIDWCFCESIWRMSLLCANVLVTDRLQSVNLHLSSLLNQLCKVSTYYVLTSGIF